MIKTLLKNITPSPVWNYLRLKYLRYSIKNFKPYVVEKSYSGFRLKTLIADGLGMGWYDQDWAMLPEIALLKDKTLINGSLVFDIGAHQGIVAEILARTVAPIGKVIAVEANPHNCDVFKKNIELNNFSNIEIVNMAIADKEGTLYFNENPNGAVDSGDSLWGRVETKATTIDHLIKKYGTPSLVFLDVEGFEENALVGASESFDTIKSWFIEVHSGCGLQSYGGSVDKIFSRFPLSHYDLFVANEEHRDFRVFDSGQELIAKMIEKRFFLIAILK